MRLGVDQFGNPVQMTVRESGRSWRVPQSVGQLFFGSDGANGFVSDVSARGTDLRI